MSLDKVAQHLAAQGRGTDSVLVHMSPKEVGALQHMAKQHGGSLSINPQTGLPEAGFLDAILPMVAGAGLAMIPGVGPLMAAGIVGGGTALLTKDLNKGLMAGLGAFGGAGLAGGIASLGAGAGAAAAGTEAAAATNSLYEAKELAAMAKAGMTPAQITQSAADFVGGPSGIGSANMPFTPATQAAISNPYSAGLSKVMDAPGAFLKSNMLPIGAALAPALMGGNGLFGKSNSAAQDTNRDGFVRPYTFNQERNPDYAGAGTPYFKQSYTAQTPVKASDFGATSVANGGIIRMAEGGETTQEQRESTANPTLEALAAIQQAQQSYQPPQPTVSQGITQPFIQPQMAQIQQQYAAPQRQAPDAFQYQAPSFVKYSNVGGGGGVGGGQAIDPITKQPVQSAAQIIAAKKPAGSGVSGTYTGPGVNGDAESYYDRYPVAEVYDYANNQPTRPFNPNSGSPEFNIPSVFPVDPSSGMAEVQQMFANQGYTEFIPSASTDYYGNTGDADGGLIADKHPRYAMGGGIGGYYPEPDDGNRNFGGIDSLNQGPQYPMQGYAGGGIMAQEGITNTRQAAVQAYAAKAQSSPQAMKELMAKAQSGDYDAMLALNSLQGTPNQNYAGGGGIYNLGGYSDGGRLLKGPGDGVSDSIPAQIGQRQPARLADGEFVVPARTVSELGNGSTDAGAKQLYAMMDRVQKNRAKTIGKGKIAVDSKSSKYLPA